ncbi:TPR-like protein [Eremomyces bilateralis CBS 781.70]|uniref:TPR-like protein n=1 Tax=Eremomyces bilateralis CBS 781.70 TaxID=1392243 RepID=A0A6G1G177_9PEZI|nr:TPR-like protein [Eremomyces bilateralis CBS 781.70]KAF1811867.1 TPR-like protein [Eremomyces bilateralis CBS 781.70]
MAANMATKPAPFPVTAIPLPPASSAPGLWEKISSWASENKVVVYTLATVTVVATGAGIYYISTADGKRPAPSETAASSTTGKKKRKNQKKKKDAAAKEAGGEKGGKKAEVEEENDGLPEVTEESVAALGEQERKDLASKLKVAGNSAYQSKNYARAISLYTQALLCKQDPVFYSNRAACYNATSEWDKVIADTTAAISLDPMYVKALNRRGHAYERSGQHSDALLDYTASCIIDHFSNETAANAVERLLQVIARERAAEMMKDKKRRLPSPTFVSNYLQSFRAKPPPQGLEDGVELDAASGLYQLQKGIAEMGRRTAESYAEAGEAFDRAVEIGGLGEHEAFAYNMRGTFRYLKGENTDALNDLTKAVELKPELTQSFIKRASMYLEEEGDQAKAIADFEKAISTDAADPDIYYHRAQLHFILGEFTDAAKDYQKSIDLDRDFIFSHIQLGVTQYKMGSVASSFATFRRCIKNFERAPEVYNYYGELLLDQQKYEEAIAKFDTAVELEKATKPMCMNVLPLINKALALFQWQSKDAVAEAQKLCESALIIDPECDIAVATMAQLLLQQSKVTEALKYFERAAELSRTENEVINALSYAEATRTQLTIQQRYPNLAPNFASSGFGGA